MISTIKELIEKIQFEGNYRITLPDGSEVVRGDGSPEWTLHLRSQQVLREMMAHPSLGFGEGYMRGEVEIEGDIQKMLHFGFEAQNQHIRPSFSQAVKLFFGYLSRRNTLEGSRKNISAHYDLGNEFYSQWLDKDHKQYTCAYFENESDTIEQAQRQKLDLVCRKLQLKPGETVVEAGCGWGGFALYAAQQYGVRMRSYNISKEQVEFAREKARRHGIGEDRIEYILDDYRTIGQDNRKYDKFVSIGMLEHVGPENYKKLYDIIAKVVKPDGLALVHSIGREAPKKMDAWLEKYIFPGAVIPTLAQ
ncbi:MAG: class I SAM-dependent methyltransferase, partial [Leptospiraceae bacterium]|nr:class I SAM-dependent methyltransferase [Leptospiraceae bacterium]